MARYNGKYDGLQDYLAGQTVARLPMKFDEIGKLVGGLPKSAKLYRTWWSNDAFHHVQANAWLGAGYRTEQVDMEKRQLLFVREAVPRGMAEEAKTYEGDKAEAPVGQMHPMIGALKGTFTIEEGYDLTRPAFEEWAGLLDEKYGPEKKT